MAKFIEVTICGKKNLINIDIVLSVYMGQSLVCLRIEDDHFPITVQESYEQIKAMLMGENNASIPQ